MALLDPLNSENELLDFDLGSKTGKNKGRRRNKRRNDFFNSIFGDSGKEKV